MIRLLLPVLLLVVALPATAQNSRQNNAQPDSNPELPVLSDRTSDYLDVSRDLEIDSGARGLEDGDFNNDGWPDLVIARTGAHALLLNDGAGKLVESNHDLGSNAPDAVKIDFNNDGWLDLAFGNGLYRNLGQNAQGIWLGFESMAASFSFTDREVAAADFDLDGNMDLLMTGTSASLYMGDGAGGFIDQTAARLIQPIERARSMTLGDVDGDGDTDIIYIQRQFRLWVIFNDGNGVFARQQNLPSPSNRLVYTIGAGDFDDDGLFEFAITYGGRGGWAFFDSDGIDENGELTWTRKSALFDGRELNPLPGFRGDNHSWTHVADMDSDGDLDFAISSADRIDITTVRTIGRSSHIMTNSGEFSGRFIFGARGNEDWAQKASVDVRIMDLNVDGNGDMVLALDQGYGVYISQAAPKIANIKTVQSTPSEIGEAAQFAVELLSGNTPEYSWNFGDGTTESTDDPAASHVYTAAGRYQVIVRVVDSTGNTDQFAFVHTVHDTLTNASTQLSSGMLHESRPDGSARVWVVNPDHNSVSVFDAISGERLAEIATGTEPVSLALDSPGIICVVNKGDATVSRVNTNNLTVVGSLTLPHASRPHGLVFDSTNDFAYITLEATGKLLKVDFSTGQIVSELTVGETPRHLSIDSSTRTVYVSRFITAPLPGESTRVVATENVGGEVWQIDADNMSVLGTVLLPYNDVSEDTETVSRGIPNYLGTPVLSPNGLHMWVPSKLDNIYRGSMRDGQARAHDALVRPMLSKIDLSTGEEIISERVFLDNLSAPSAALLNSTGSVLYVIHEGSEAVTVYDVLGGTTIEKIKVGAAPRALVLSDDDQTLFVHNWLDRTVSSYDVNEVVRGVSSDTTTNFTSTTIDNEALSPEVLLGKQLFFTAKPEMSSQFYIACASCHDDAGHDGRVWDFSDAGEGLRNTIDLRGRAGISQGNVHWSANFDEIQDFENDVREIFGGAGLLSNADFTDSAAPLDALNKKGGRSPELDALAAYTASLTRHGDSPYRNANGSLTAAGARGKDLFRAADCALCHSGTPFTDSPSAVGHNVGTVDGDTGGRLGQALLDGGHDTPTLRGLWHGAPYLHDGSALTVQQAVLAHSSGMNFNVATLATDELDDLAAYLLQIDDSEPLASSVNDFDGDGISNAVDPDDDNDGVDDVNDAFPDDPLESADSDGDGVGDNADALPNDATETTDIDGDGVGDNADVFPANPNEFRDVDGDGIGDNADTDADNDGIPDELESRVSVDLQVATLLSTSLTAFELAAAGDWVSVSAVEYEALMQSLNNASAFGTAEENMLTGPLGNFGGGNMYTFGQTNNPSPSNSNFVAFKRGSDLPIRGGNDIVRLSDITGRPRYSAVGRPLPDGVVENGQEYFVQKGSQETAYANPQHLGLSTDENFIYYLATGTTGSMARGSTPFTPRLEYAWSMQGIAVPAVESVALAWDIDDDGRPNEFDLDSDNDGVPDVIEAGGDDTNNDGYIDDAATAQGSLISPLDADNNGTMDYLEISGNTLIANPITDEDDDGWDDSVDGLIGTSPVSPPTPTLPSPTPPTTTAPSNPSNGLLVDGNFADWSGIVAYAGDPDDVSGPDNTLDFASAWMAHDDDNLYVRYDNHTPDVAQLTWGYSLQLDTDANPATGFRGFANELPVGVDYMIEGNTLHRYTGNGSDFSWGPGISIVAMIGANALEMVIPRSSIGNPVSMRLFLYANSEAVNGTAVDFYPNAAADILAPVADRSFDYYLGSDLITPAIDQPDPSSPTVPTQVFYNPATISVDGNLADWGALISFGDDPDDATGTGNTIDWREGWMAHDANNFYIGWRNDDAAVVSWGNGIMIDSDQNPSTGFKGFDNELSIGVDYLLEDRAIHRYAGSGSDWLWVDGGTMNPVVAGVNTEIQIARSLLGSPAAMNLFFTGNNEAVGGNVTDYYPDSASDTSASLSNRAFTYSTVEPTTPTPAPTEVNIVLDGIVNEWPADSVLGGDDANDVGGQNTIDWRSLRVMDDANNLYMAYESWETVNLSWGYGIYIDTDQNPATGFKGFDNELSVGAEYLLEGIDLNRYTGSEQNLWSWESAGLMQVATAGNIAELTLPRSVIGNPLIVDILLRGDNTAVNGDAVDYHPNTGNTLGKLTYRFSTLQNDEPEILAAQPGGSAAGGGSFGLWSLAGLLLLGMRRRLSVLRKVAGLTVAGTVLSLSGCGDGGLVLGPNSNAEDTAVTNPGGNSNTANPVASGNNTVPINNPSFRVSNGDRASANASFALNIATALDGTQTIPPVPTLAAGATSVSLNSLTGELTGSVTHTVRNATGASIREGGIGESGAVVVALVREDANTFVVPANTVLNGAQITAFNQAMLHVSVLSVANPNGEIRSQLSSEIPALTLQPTLDDIQVKVFSPTCSGCHNGGGSTLPGIMNLSTSEASYNTLVNTPALSAPGLDRIAAGNSQDSLIVRKLEGTHQIGSQMPFRGTPLDTSTVDTIREWIDSGASY